MEDLYNDYLKKLALSQNPEDKLSPTWDEMNKRLNKEMPQKKDRKKIIFFWASLFLILSVGLGYYFIANDSKSTALQGNNTSIFDKEKNGNDVRFNTPSKLNNIGTIDEKIPINEGLIAGNSTSSTKPVIFKKEAKRVFSNAPIYGKSLPNKNIFQNEKKIAVSNIGLANPVSIPGKKSVNKQTQNQANIEQTVRDNNDQSDINLRDKNEKPAFGKSNDALIPAEKSKENIKVDSVVSTVKDGQPINTEKKKISNSKHATWELVPTVAADYLIANIKPFTIPGFLAGVGVNYVINKHVSLRAGVLFNHIRVSSTGENYYYKPQYTAPNYSTVKVEDVKGFINALEIPLSVRYTINPMSKFSIHLVAGISSMFYLKTDCTYKLLINETSYQYWNSKDDKNNEYGKAEILDNLRLGAGISYRFSKNISLELEPSYKLPLEELGEEHKKIGSFSFNLSVRLPLLRKL